MVNCDAAFSKTICSICHEDFDPIIEDLQVISICGHVFHELCLQEWFGCLEDKNKNRHSCPVCKQSCKPNDVARLYFQWADPSLTQTPTIECKEDSEALRREVKRLEAMAIGLGSALELEEKEFKLLNEELCLSQEEAMKAVALMNEALKQQASLQQLLHMKSEEFDKLRLECLRLQERNMALDKELAAVKLVSDLDLDEDEVLKIASLGNGVRKKETIDVLRKSLVMSNRSNKELMAKCNILERKEARYSRKREKARGKIDKFRTRIQELETAVEVKNKELSRALKKAAKKTRGEGVIQNSVNLEASYRKTPAADIADVVIIDDYEKVQCMPSIRKEHAIPQPLPKPGDACFSSGLLGPDGTNRYLGKWCKRRHKNGSIIMHDSPPTS